MQNDEIVYGRDALKNGEPWIVPAALHYLKDILKDNQNWNVFEWGSGGSTVYWSNNCANVISIEQNKEWVDRTLKMLNEFKCKPNHTVIYINANKDDYTAYAHSIENYDNESFDLIYVDGEAACRDLCIALAIPKLKTGGYLLVDNSNWVNKNQSCIKLLFTAILRDLHWVGIKEPFDWETSIFRKV